MLSFLPPESRSVRSRSHYRNCIRWICGVYYRLEHFRAEQEGQDVHEVFDVADDIEDFTRQRRLRVRGREEQRPRRAEARRSSPPVLGGNRHRFRRMYFNLVMNAVDAMAGRKVGVIHVSSRVEGDRVVFAGERQRRGHAARRRSEQLLADRETLDGELHSLGFVFVRQTVGEFGGTLEIASEPAKGTTVTVRLPFLPDAVPPPRQPSRCEKYGLPDEDLRSLVGRRPPGGRDRGRPSGGRASRGPGARRSSRTTAAPTRPTRAASSRSR